MLLRQTSVYLNPVHLKALDRIAKQQGLRSAEVLRIAIAQYIARERRKKLTEKVLLASVGPAAPVRQAVAVDDED